MLQIASNNQPSGTSNREGTSTSQLDVLALLRILYRRWRMIAAIVAVGMVLGLAYTITATRRYTADFSILVVPAKGSLLARDDASPDRLMDPGVVESQVEVLKSDSVAAMAVRALDLTKDPTVMGQPPGWLGSAIGGVTHMFSAKADHDVSQADLDQQAVDNITAALKVQRVGATYVLQTSYTNTDPLRSAQIANGLANAYLVSQLDARYQATRRAADWLQTRLKALRDETSTAELAVQRFKAENGIVDTARGLITDQQLTDASTQLATAHDNTSAAKADLDRIQDVLKSDNAVNATVPEALKDEVLNRLRAQYLDLSSRYADLLSRFGPKHQAVIKLQSQMNDITKVARDELGRIAESLKSTYESAAAKESAVRQDLQTAVTRADSTNKAQVQLRDLESTAQTYRNLYDNMLDKLQQTTQEQTSPEDGARIITAATVPGRPSSPKLIVTMAAAIVGSLGLGVILAVVRELVGNGFKTAEDVMNYAGLEHLGTLPRIAVNRRTARALRFASPTPTPATTILGSHSAVARHALLAPFSRFTEIIRGVKVSIDIAKIGHNASITGIVSAVPKEGKTTFAANLALMTAQMGHRTLLIDGDMHNPSLTRTLSPDAQLGLIDLLEHRSTITNVVLKDQPTGLYFIPTVVKQRKPNSVSLLTSETMSKLLATFREQFEFVIIDLPPIVPVVDVKASATMFDNFVFVTEWSKTSRDVVRDALLTSEHVRERILGVVLNKADAFELKRLESYKGPAYDSYYVEADKHNAAV